MRKPRMHLAIWHTPLATTDPTQVPCKQCRQAWVFHEATLAALEGAQ